MSKQETYILKEDINEENLAKLESYFAEAGYTWEDYQEDLKETRGSPFFELKRHDITYEFNVGANNTQHRSELLQLAGLCDKMNSAIFQNRFADTEVNKQDSIKNQLVQNILETRTKKDNADEIESIICNQYELDSSSFSVTVEDVEKTDNDGLRITVYVSRD